MHMTSTRRRCRSTSRTSSEATGKTALKNLVFGYLGTDRHGADNFWPRALRQFCWSHLQRDFTAISERDGEPGVVGKKRLAETARMFAWWHRVRDGTLDRATFKVYMVLFAFAW